MDNIDDKDILAFTKGLEHSIIDLSKKHSKQSFHHDIVRNIIPLDRAIKYYEGDK